MTKKLHKHHIIPKHAGGTDDPSNLVLLTVEEHAEAHKKLWLECGREQDYIAWKTLSNQITIDEARRLSVSIALKGKLKSKEQKEKMSIARKKRGGITTGMKLGPCSDERKRKISEANKGGPGRPYPCSEEHKKNLSIAAKNRKQFICPKCNNFFQKANLVRYHGLNGEKCKN
jgi:hypothetical protein